MIEYKCKEKTYKDTSAITTTSQPQPRPPQSTMHFHAVAVRRRSMCRLRHLCSQRPMQARTLLEMWVLHHRLHLSTTTNLPQPATRPQEQK